jgi:hypothetical protein
LGIDHDLDLDHDMDLDHDLDLDHDVALDHDAGLDHDLDHDIAHDIGHDVSGGLPAWAEVLQFLGVGQAPVTMVLLILLGGFGIFGWIMNGLVLGLSPAYYGWMLVLVLGVDAVVGAWFTGQVARLIGQAVPAFVSTATSLNRLVSRRGRVASPQVDETYGQVKVRDVGGTLITVFAVVDPGQAPIPRDTEVILVEYNAAKKVFVVVPSDM